jgi:hypothetical protein
VEQGAPTLNVLPSDHIVIPRSWFNPDNTIILFVLTALGTSVAMYAAFKD